MANSTIQADYMPDGRVRFIINIGIGDPVSWAAYVHSKQDHGQGPSGLESYPYFVEMFSSSNTQTVYRTYSAGNYIVELGLQGIGIVDDDTFDVGGGGGVAGNIVVTSISVSPNPVVSGAGVEIIANLRNDGDVSATENVYLKSDGVVISTDSRMINAHSTGRQIWNRTAGSSQGFAVGSHNICAETSGDSKCISLIVNSAVQSWKCLTSPYWRCELQSGPGGFATEAECIANCQNIPRYSCSDGQCVSSNCNPGSPNCYLTSNCDNMCGVQTHIGCNNTTSKCETKSGGGGNTDGCTFVGQTCGIPVNNYGCYNGQCLQGYGNLPPGCNNTCVTPIPKKYNCISNKCKGPYAEGTYDSLAECQASGCSSGGEEDPCAKCDRNKEFCIFGQCIKKNDAYMGIGAVVLLMVLSRR